MDVNLKALVTNHKVQRRCVAPVLFHGIDEIILFPSRMQDDLSQADVTIIGGGLAGMAAAIHLARSGMQVLCIEADQTDSHAVGESLDWSAPDLLSTLGLPMERLIAEEIATYKRHVILKLEDGSDRHYIPSDWLGRPPFNIELRTLHVDRILLNKALRGIALSHGIKLVSGKVSGVEKDGRRVTAVSTIEGIRISSSWFIDASGSATSLFPRMFQLPIYEYGPRKVAMWSYFTVPESIEGTTLYAGEAKPSYMEWVWEIPIHPNTVSVGYVTPGDAMKLKRQDGQTVEDIYKEQLNRFPRVEELAKSDSSISLYITSFRCRVYGKIHGPNWLVVGESASMVDPMTSNGVTAALRHATEAARLIVKSRHRQTLPYLSSAMYSRRARDLARFFNSGIEKVIYDWPIRNRIGALNAGDVYTVPAWSINALYSRIRPQGLVSTTLFGLFLASLRSAASFFHWLCRRFPSPSPECSVS